MPETQLHTIPVMPEQQELTKIREPHEVTKVPMHFEGGFGYDVTRHRRVNAELNRQGRETTAPLPDPLYRGVDTGFHITISGEERKYTRDEAMRLVRLGAATIEQSVASFTRDRAQELYESFEKAGVESADLMLQSAGALTGLEFAAEHPDKVNNIALIHPGGLTKLKNPFHAAPGIAYRRVRVARQSKQKLTHEDIFDQRTIRDRVRSRMNPNRDTITPPLVALSQQGRKLTELRHKENAPGILMVAGANDPLFTPEGLIEGLDTPDNVDRILVVNTGHGIKGDKKVMGQILDEFAGLDKIKQARATGQALPPLHERIIFTEDVPKKRRQAIIAKAIEREFGMRPKESVAAKYMAAFVLNSYLGAGHTKTLRKRSR